MLKKTNFLLLSSFALTAACLAPAHAEEGASALQSLANMDRPFHSRTCGLVLLSDGRAQTRAAKAKGTGDFAPAMAHLTKAFLLLRDGRELKVSAGAPRDYFAQRLSTGRSTKPFNQALPQATAHCEQWFEERKTQPDFDRSDEAQSDAAAQAELTLRTE